MKVEAGAGVAVAAERAGAWWAATILATRKTTPTTAPASSVMKGILRFMPGGTQRRAERFYPAGLFSAVREDAGRPHPPCQAVEAAIGQSAVVTVVAVAMVVRAV